VAITIFKRYHISVVYHSVLCFYRAIRDTDRMFLYSNLKIYRLFLLNKNVALTLWIYKISQIHTLSFRTNFVTIWITTKMSSVKYSFTCTAICEGLIFICHVHTFEHMWRQKARSIRLIDFRWCLAYIHYEGDVEIELNSRRRGETDLPRRSIRCQLDAISERDARQFSGCRRFLRFR